MLPGREIAENQNNGHGSGSSSTSQMDERDWDSPRNIASIYEQYIAGLSEIGQLPFLLRYNAFPEAHLDSLENPAYATGFRAAEGRVVVLPSLNGTGGLDENPTPPGLSAVSPLNYSAASQFSMFVPLAGFVIGGSTTGSKIGSGVQGAPSDLGSMMRLSNWRHRIWQPAIEQAGLPLSSTPYVLRHTAASLMAQQGVPVSTAAAALGHDPAIYLRTYAHLYPGDLRSAADAMDAVRTAARKEKPEVPAKITRTGKVKKSEVVPDVVPVLRGDSAGMGISEGGPKAPASA
jgi:hypothetical protein